MTLKLEIAKFYTAAEIADLKLPGLPTTDRAIQIKAKQEDWSFIDRKGRGGGKLYAIDALPERARQALTRRSLNQSNVVVKTPLLKTGENLKDYQRQTMLARIGVLNEWQRISDDFCLSRSRAAKELVILAKSGGLDGKIAELIPLANARSGQTTGKRSLSRTSLYRWLDAVKKGQKSLAPKSRNRMIIPIWADLFMGLWARPQKPSLTCVVEQMQDELDGNCPSYGQVRRFLKKLDPITQNKGRMGPREIKKIMAFYRRDVSDLWPSAVYTADGHTFDAEVAHPIHGQPFRPEITTIIDVFTRRVVGWSAALSEQTWGTLDAIRHSFTECGICTIWYVDNGSGFKNDHFDDMKCMSFFGRLGVTKTHSLPYNSQARGIGERIHKVHIKSAKRLASYMGEDMDPEAKQKVFKITRKDIKEFGRSKLLIEWDEFLQLISHGIDLYNEKPHSSLPKIRDLETAKKRHMTPLEMWNENIDKGIEVETVDPMDEDTFRPYEVRKTRRGEIQIFNNTYFNHDLEFFHDEDVYVGYDIHNPEHVWVRNMEGQFICVAKWGGNKTGYFPTSFVDQAAEKRTKGRLRRIDNKRTEIEAERNPAMIIEHQADPGHSDNVVSFDQMARAEHQVKEIEAQSAGACQNSTVKAPANSPAGERPRFSGDEDWAAWLATNPEKATPKDKEHLIEMLRNPTKRMLLEINGTNIQTLEKLRDEAANQGDYINA